MDRLKDFIDWLLGRPKPPAQLRSFFAQSVLEDYDFHMLVQSELNALKANRHKIRPLLLDSYLAMGGTYENAKLIFVTLVMAMVKKKLDERLTGPLSLIRGKVEEVITEVIEKAFDEFWGKI